MAAPLAIALPRGSLHALLRHPALRVAPGGRGAWEPREDFAGRARRMSAPGARPALTLLEGEAGLWLLAEGQGGAALGAALAVRLRALPEIAGPPGMPQPDASPATPAAALAAGLRAGIGHLLAHAGACSPDAPPLGVHQSRVAIRRMRSQLRLFRPALGGLGLDDTLEAFGAALRDLAALLGPARDWDVFQGGLGGLLAEALPGDRRLARLLRRAERARRAAYAALAPALDGPSFRALAWQGMALAEALDAADDGTPLRPFAEAVLARRHRRLRRAGRGIETLPAEQLHMLRLDGKKLRYAADLLEFLWEGGRARKYQRRLARLQEALGLANDAAVARSLVAGLGVRGWMLGMVEGFALARGADSREMALDAWRRWRKAPRFWESD